MPLETKVILEQLVIQVLMECLEILAPLVPREGLEPRDRWDILESLDLMASGDPLETRDPRVSREKLVTQGQQDLLDLP